MAREGSTRAPGRVAHFLDSSALAGSPPNETLIRICLELGLGVDVFSPRALPDTTAYGPMVEGHRASYGRKWLARNVPSRRWRAYSLIMGTTEDPIAAVGTIAAMHRKPSLVLADEIKSGAYAGSRPARWKRLCQWGMRRASLTIVNDPSRIALQRAYAGVPESSPVIVYPGSFHELPAPTDGMALRRRLGIPEDAFLLGYSGTFYEHNGALWVAEALRRLPTLHIYGQMIGTNDMVMGLLSRLQGAERLHLETARLPWREAWSRMASVDMGMSVYLHEGPQFKHMGVASNRLCMFLGMGVPVIATRQPSFEFLETQHAGTLVENEQGFLNALEQAMNGNGPTRAGAHAAWRDDVRAVERQAELHAAIASLVSKQT